MFNDIVQYIQSLYPDESGIIPLHAPQFVGCEREYVLDAINSTFVSSVGEYVNKFENLLCSITGAKHAIATVNGTSALHVSLRLVGVTANDLVLTQSLTFVATCNAISYLGANPVFIDINSDHLSLCPLKLRKYLEQNAKIIHGKCVNKNTGQVIRACVVMHTFGHPAKLDELKNVCSEFCVELVEDAAESLGSFFAEKHTGLMGRLGVLSFNGNKIVTTGGGGAIITNDESLAMKAKHLTTTAKINSKYEFDHDEIAYNYRLPNINAALGCGQLEQLNKYLQKKRKLAQAYNDFFSGFNEIKYIKEPHGTTSNYWLNTILMVNKKERDKFLSYSNEAGVTTRPAWKPMHMLSIYSHCEAVDLQVTENLYDRLVNIPSSVVEVVNV